MIAYNAIKVLLDIVQARKEVLPMINHMKLRFERICQAVNDYYRENQRSPSVREIAHRTGLKRSTVHNYLRQMDEEGLIRYNGQIILTPEIQTKQRGCRDVPIVSAVACGEPDQGDLFSEESMELPISLTGLDDDVCLYEAFGESMIGAGIESGDLVLIRIQEAANSGDIILAEVPGQGLTLKRYKVAGRQAYLHPENPEFPDIKPGFFKIRGVATWALKPL